MRKLLLLPVLALAVLPGHTAQAPSVLEAMEKEVAALAARALPGVVRVRAGGPRAPRLNLREEIEKQIPRVLPQLREELERALRGAGPEAREQIQKHLLDAVAAAQTRELLERGLRALPDGREVVVRMALRGFQESTGFVWDRQGRIVTAGLAADQGEVTVTLSDGREAPGKVLGADALTGMAVVQVAVEGLAPLAPGDSTALRPGSWTVTLGGGGGVAAPFPGVVAEVGREAPGSLRVTGVPPDVSPGAPVLNARGEVVGILAAGRGAGSSPAIPLHEARPVIEQLAAGQAVRRGYLGVQLSELDDALMQIAGLKEKTGVFVQDVVAGGPAAAAGLQAEDVILAVNGKPVRNPAGAAAAVRGLAPGKEARLTLWRKGEKVEVVVVVGEMPPEVQVGQGRRRGGDAPEPFGGGGQGPIVVAPFGDQGRGADLTGRPVSVEIQATGLADALARVLNGTGCPFRIAPELLEDRALAGKPFGLKAANTPLKQVLDQMAAHYGIRWRWANGAVQFEKR